MIIENVTLKNYKRISNINEPTFSCNPDLNVLVGANNSGKTSIIQAIATVLQCLPDNQLDWQRSLSYTLNSLGTIQLELQVKLSKKEWSDLIQIRASVDENAKLLFKEEIISSLPNIPVMISSSIVLNNIPNFTLHPEFSLIIDGSYFPTFPHLNSINWLVPRVQSVLDHSSTANYQALFGKPIYFDSTSSIEKQEQFISRNQLKGSTKGSANIRAKLYYLKQDSPEQYNYIQKELLDIFPELDTIDVILDEDNGVFQFTLSETMQFNGNTRNVKYDVSDVGLGMQEFLVIASTVLFHEPSVVLMDEPDAHMHPSLVKQFVELLRKLSDRTQFFLTTHSIPLIEAVDAEHIYLVEYNRETKGSLVRNLEHKDKIIEVAESIGFEIPQFLRTISPKAYVFIEGSSDKDLLLSFAQKGRYSEMVNGSSIQFIPMGGKGNRFKIAQLIETLDGQFFDKPILVLLDRDETDEKEIEKLRVKFKANADRLVYLQKRQIENYLIDSQALCRLIVQKSKYIDSSDLPSEDVVIEKIKLLSENQQDKVLSMFLEEKFRTATIISDQEFRKIFDNYSDLPIAHFVSKINGEIAGKFVERTSILGLEHGTIAEKFYNEWNQLEKRLDMCDGRELLKEIRKWIQEEFRLSFSNEELIQNLSEIPKEIDDILFRISHPETLLPNNRI